MNSTPVFLQVSVSVGLIGREALLMSVSARQNFWKPPPVPEVPTWTSTAGFSFLNSSATASAMGYTVLEPSTLIEPAAPPDAPDWPSWGPPPQAATTSERTTTDTYRM